MSVGRICTRSVLVASPEETARAAARRMRDARVGTLVVVDGQMRPSGVITDRDLTVRVLAAGRDPDATPLRELMSQPPDCASEALPIEEALSLMAASSSRRLVITDDAGKLVGILALDDVLELLVEEAASIGRILKR
jgi:CBS domain-containing protein